MQKTSRAVEQTQQAGNAGLVWPPSPSSRRTSCMSFKAATAARPENMYYQTRRTLVLEATSAEHGRSGRTGRSGR
eukprot:16442610-Heterocapsa_arctica.AAC.1